MEEDRCIMPAMCDIRIMNPDDDNLISLERQIEKSKFFNSFVIMPEHCNYMLPMVFGGAFFAQMDLAAACCVDGALESVCKICVPYADRAVTHKFEGTFHAAAQLGDIISLEAEIVSVGKKSLKVSVQALRKKRGHSAQDLVATAHFVFVTKSSLNDIFVPHFLYL